jgi:hypothetical protein
MQVGSFNGLSKGSKHTVDYSSDLFPERIKICKQYVHKHLTEGKCISILFSKDNRLCRPFSSGSRRAVLLQVASTLSESLLPCKQNHREYGPQRKASSLSTQMHAPLTAAGSWVQAIH